MDAHEQMRDQFQEELDALHPGGTLQLSGPRERPGPVEIARRGVTIDGQGITLWSMRGPALAVRADRVVLKNIRVEYTGETGSGPIEEECAIEVSGSGVSFENVEVRGAVIGIPQEEGDWRYPTTLYLGRLAHGMEHHLIVQMIVPVPCQLTSNISGLELEPANLTPGAHDVKIHIERFPRDTLLNGTILLTTAFLKRRMEFSAHIMEPRPGDEPPDTEQGRIVWKSDAIAPRPITPRSPVSVRSRPVAPVSVVVPVIAPSAPAPTPSIPLPAPTQAAIPIAPPTLRSTPTSGGIRRISSSPLSSLFSPKPTVVTTEPAPMSPPFLGSTPTAPPPPVELGPPLPPTGTGEAPAKLPRSVPIKSRPVSSIFSQPVKKEPEPPAEK